MTESDNLPVPAYKTLRWDQAAYLQACYEALAMKVRGMQYRAIAEAQGTDVATAHRRVRAAILANGAADVETERTLDLTRLDAYLSVIHDSLVSGNLDAVDKAFRALDLRAKLLGLYAAQKVDATVTMRDAMDAELADVVAEAKAKWDADVHET